MFNFGLDGLVKKQVPARESNVILDGALSVHGAWRRCQDQPSLNTVSAGLF